MRAKTAFAFALSLPLLAAACGDDETTNPSTTTTTTTTTTTDTGTAGGGGTGGEAPAPLAVQLYASDPAGPAVNSVLITGEQDAVLVDGQLFKADAEAVIALVQESGKNLRTVFLTHPHPDHYLGLQPIQAAFPDAQFVATQAVLDDYNASAQGTLDFIKMSFGDQVADSIATLTPLSGDTIDLEGHALRVIEVAEPGESVHAAILTIEDQDAVVAGDLVYNNVHLVLSECASDGWLANLEALRQLGHDTIYPGHGAETTADILDIDAMYIEDAVAIMNAAATADEAKAQIKAQYPEYASDFLLGFSVDGYFTNCLPQP